jgi:hypothetical protein
MNALPLKPAWKALAPARRLRLKRKALGFVLYEALRRPGLPAPAANAQARFEHDARHALREWLML